MKFGKISKSIMTFWLIGLLFLSIYAPTNSVGNRDGRMSNQVTYEWIYISDNSRFDRSRINFELQIFSIAIWTIACWGSAIAFKK